MKTIKKKQISFLKKYIESIRGQLTRNQRAKIVALVTIEVHARDVIDLLIKKGEFDENSFGWLQQLRLYWGRKGELLIKIRFLGPGQIHIFCIYF